MGISADQKGGAMILACPGGKQRFVIVERIKQYHAADAPIGAANTERSSGRTVATAVSDDDDAGLL